MIYDVSYDVSQLATLMCANDHVCSGLQYPGYLRHVDAKWRSWSSLLLPWRTGKNQAKMKCTFVQFRSYVFPKVWSWQVPDYFVGYDCARTACGAKMESCTILISNVEKMVCIVVVVHKNVVVLTLIMDSSFLRSQTYHLWSTLPRYSRESETWRCHFTAVRCRGKVNDVNTMQKLCN